MSDDQGQQEDVAGLFRKFGGDASSYKEFAPAESAERASGQWALLNGGMPAADVPQPGPASPPALLPAAAIVAPVPPPAPSPASVGATGPAAPALSNRREARELDALFARLAGVAHPAIGNGQGLMSSWRKPS